MTQSVIALSRKMLLDTRSSPVQISARLAREHGIPVSHESIYRYIWAGANTSQKAQILLHSREAIVDRKLNNGPRKLSNYETPQEVMAQITQPNLGKYIQS